MWAPNTKNDLRIYLCNWDEELNHIKNYSFFFQMIGSFQKKTHALNTCLSVPHYHLKYRDFMIRRCSNISTTIETIKHHLVWFMCKFKSWNLCTHKNISFRFDCQLTFNHSIREIWLAKMKCIRFTLSDNEKPLIFCASFKWLRCS